MIYEDTTQKMANEVAASCRELREDIEADRARWHWHPEGDHIPRALHTLAAAVEKLANCVARRFPEADMPGCTVTQIDPLTQERRTRVCGGITVPTGACSTCTVCGTTGGCG